MSPIHPTERTTPHNPMGGKRPPGPKAGMKGPPRHPPNPAPTPRPSIMPETTDSYIQSKATQTAMAAAPHWSARSATARREMV